MKTGMEWIDRHDPIQERAPEHWEQGLPLGNGKIGAIVWAGRKDRPLNISLDQAEILELRGRTLETGESGFLFAYLELLTEAGELTLQAVHHVLIIRDIPYQGSFSCDDELLNQIWKTAAWTVHLNMQYYLLVGIKKSHALVTFAL